VAVAEQGLRLEWRDPKDRLDWALAPVAGSAAELLTGEDVRRLRECPGSPRPRVRVAVRGPDEERQPAVVRRRAVRQPQRGHRHYERERAARASAPGETPG